MNEKVQAKDEFGPDKFGPDKLSDKLHEELGELQYEFQDGYIHSWLVAGPVKTSVADLEHYQGIDFKAQIARAYHRNQKEVQLAPAEGRKFEVEDPTGSNHVLAWQVVRCGDDHYVNLSGFYPTCHYLYAWAYAKVVVPSLNSVAMTLTTNGPADLWINGKHAHRQEHHALQRPESRRFLPTLRKGENELLIRFEVVAARACPFLMALHIEPPPSRRGSLLGTASPPHDVAAALSSGKAREDLRPSLPQAQRLPFPRSATDLLA